MTILTSLAGVSAPDNLGYAQLPSLARCQHYHLLGGDQAGSAANRVPGGPPLGVIGAPAYEADCAVLTAGAGFVTPGKTGYFSRSAILVFADAYKTMATPAAPTFATSADSFTPYLSFADRYGAVMTNGASMQWRPTADGTYDILGNQYRTRDFPVFYPDGSSRRGRFALVGISSDGATARLYLQNGGVVEVSSISLAGHPALADSTATVGGFNDANTVSRIAAVAIFAGAMASDAEMLANMSVVAADVEARGLDFSPFLSGGAV